MNQRIFKLYMYLYFYYRLYLKQNNLEHTNYVIMIFPNIFYYLFILIYLYIIKIINIRIPLNAAR